jgi:hypothetical protein
MNNAGSAIGAYGNTDGSGAEPDATAYTAAMNELELSDVYACAFMTHHDIESAMKTAVESASTPENKKERIAICNQKIPSTGTPADDYRAAAPNKPNQAAGIRDQNAAYNSKRLVMTHPDIVYVEETRHVTSLEPAWITDSFGGSSQFMGTYADFTAVGAYAKFTGTTNVGSKQYYYWDDITAAV